VFTDWLIVRRIAAELDQAVSSGRIREVGMTADGRLALRVRARGAGGDVLLVDAFGDVPLVTMECGVEIAAAPGFPRAVADALRGMRVEGVRARRGDRLIAVDAATLSRFGVLSRYRLVAELVPRYGNVLLLKDDVIVATAREFGPDKNPQRPVVVGERYIPPPLPAATLSLDQLAQALNGAGDAAPAIAKALRAHRPLLPHLIALSLATEAVAAGGGEPAARAALLVQRADDALAASEGSADPLGDIVVYRDGARIVQAHVVPLAQYAQYAVQREASMLEVAAAAAQAERSAKVERGADARRGALLARLRKRSTALGNERAALEKSAAGDDEAERLRAAGDLLYAHHALVPPGATSFTPPDGSAAIVLDPEFDAKANAAAIFKRYRKAVGRRTYAQQRLASLSEEIASVEELAWEVERADAGALDELIDDADRLERRARPSAGRPQARRRALEVALAEDARVLIGRSPQNNAELTFHVARPHDLWFHARGVPGAHVVLRIDSARQPTSAELRSAAEFAAFHSKARTSGVVPVDYTARKFVRKRQNALPGLVWYTNAKTIDVSPRSPNLAIH
jgi:predicted ribosome quality control (RQC) complex YloA/Tae2 family protein